MAGIKALKGNAKGSEMPLAASCHNADAHPHLYYFSTGFLEAAVEQVLRLVSACDLCWHCSLTLVEIITQIVVLHTHSGSCNHKKAQDRRSLGACHFSHPDVCASTTPR